MGVRTQAHDRGEPHDEPTTRSSFPPPAGCSTWGRGRRRSGCGGTSRPPTRAVGRRKACARRRIKFIKD